MMKTDRSILLAFFLNLGFSVFEFAGGIITGSAAIAADALHDMGDAVGIGVSYVLERKSRRVPDARHTYGGAGYSVLGGVVTMLILLLSSAAMAVHAVRRLLHPVAIDYAGMTVFALVGLAVNLCAVFVTRKGDSFGQRAVNLHLLEDVLGWAAVLIGAVIMRFTDFARLDPLLSLGAAAFVAVHALRHLKEAADLLLAKTPDGIDPDALQARLCALDGVAEVHHIHVWSLDGHTNCATAHIVTDAAPADIKQAVRAALREFGIVHATLETETGGEACGERRCCLEEAKGHEAAHHHHHHHH